MEPPSSNDGQLGQEDVSKRLFMLVIYWVLFVSGDVKCNAPLFSSSQQETHSSEISEADSRRDSASAGGTYTHETEIDQEGTSIYSPICWKKLFPIFQYSKLFFDGLLRKFSLYFYHVSGPSVTNAVADY